MIAHPLILCALVLDVCALAAIAATAAGAFRIALHWAPAAAGPMQLSLEAAAESVSIMGRLGVTLFAAAAGLLLVALTLVMPGLVPGAMCGTGVLQACHPAGRHAVMYRLAAFALLYLWSAADAVNSRHPMAPAAPVVARLMLFALPLAALAWASAWSTISLMDTHQPVDCCMVVYDQFSGPKDTTVTAGLPNTFWAGAFAVTTVMTAMAGLAAARWTGRTVAVVSSACVLLWAPSALVVMTQVLGPYVYGVLHHHCPWCLFTASGTWLGFPLLIAAGVAVLESAVMPTMAWLAAGHSSVGGPAGIRMAAAGRHAAAAVLFFAAVSTAPALWWYWRFGVWITGSAGVQP